MSVILPPSRCGNCAWIHQHMLVAGDDEADDFKGSLRGVCVGAEKVDHRGAWKESQRSPLVGCRHSCSQLVKEVPWNQIQVLAQLAVDAARGDVLGNSDRGAGHQGGVEVAVGKLEGIAVDDDEVASHNDMGSLLRVEVEPGGDVERRPDRVDGEELSLTPGSLGPSLGEDPARRFHAVDEGRPSSHEDAASLLWEDEAVGDKDGDGLADRGMGCAVAVDEFTGRWESVTGQEFLPVDGVAEVIGDLAEGWSWVGAIDGHLQMPRPILSTYAGEESTQFPS